MFLSMLKKEIKQFFRRKANVFLMFAFPIMLITVLSVGLKDMMSGNGDIFGTKDEYSEVYYTIEDGSKYEEGFTAFKDGIQDNIHVKFIKTDDLEVVKEKVDNYDGLLHINVSKDGFEIYSSEKGEKFQSKIFRSIFEDVLEQYALYDTIGEYNPEAFKSLVENKYEEYVVKEGNNGVKNVTAAEYYTFAELALIILYISTIVGESVYSEVKFRTINRIKLSKVNENSIIMSKVSLGIIIGIIQTLLVYFYSSYVLDVSWGENTLKFFALFIALSVFASMLGAIIGISAKRDTTVSGVLSGVIVGVCFLGGCYTPIQVIAPIPIINKLIYLSPIYWINTATSSMVSGINATTTYYIALAIPLIVSALLLILYSVIVRKNGGLSND